MGQRVTKEDIKSPHFYFKQVGNRNQYNREFIVAYFPIRTQDQFGEWERNYKLANQCNKQSLLLPQSYDKYPIKKYMACCQCPADYQMSIVYERFDSLYKTQLATRQSGANKRYYRQEELFHILYELTAGIKQFQVKGLKFGDIRPSKMAITESANGTKMIKMINNYTSPVEISPLDKIIEKYDNSTIFYLAPQEIVYINSPARNAIVPNPKTEAFSLGVTMIQAAILQNSQNFYGKSPRSIDLKLIQARLKTLNTRYPLLKYYIQLLVKQKAEQRYSCGELYSLLKPYAESISSLKKFSRKQNQQSSSLMSFRKSNK